MTVAGVDTRRSRLSRTTGIGVEGGAVAFGGVLGLPAIGMSVSSGIEALRTRTNGRAVGSSVDGFSLV